MSEQQHISQTSRTAELTQRAAELKRSKQWEELAALATELPRDWGQEWLELASNAAFACTKLGRTTAALEVLLRAYEVAPDHRTASALAYVHYDALLRHKVRKPRLDDPEPYREGFERWIAEALRLKPESIVDRYRLGVYHASIQSQKDAAALQAFQQALRLFERLPEAERTPQSRHFKTYVRALYGAARSAFRLRRYPEARRFIFRCIRFAKRIVPLPSFCRSAIRCWPTRWRRPCRWSASTRISAPCTRSRTGARRWCAISWRSTGA